MPAAAGGATAAAVVVAAAAALAIYLRRRPRTGVRAVGSAPPPGDRKAARGLGKQHGGAGDDGGREGSLRMTANPLLAGGEGIPRKPAAPAADLPMGTGLSGGGSSGGGAVVSNGPSAGGWGAWSSLRGSMFTAVNPMRGQPQGGGAGPAPQRTAPRPLTIGGASGAGDDGGAPRSGGGKRAAGDDGDDEDAPLQKPTLRIASAMTPRDAGGDAPLPSGRRTPTAGRGRSTSDSAAVAPALAGSPLATLQSPDAGGGARRSFAEISDAGTPPLSARLLRSSARLAADVVLSLLGGGTPPPAAAAAAGGDGGGDDSVSIASGSSATASDGGAGESDAGAPGGGRRTSAPAAVERPAPR